MAAKRKKAKAKKKSTASGGLAKKVHKLSSRVTHIEHFLKKASAA
jgi:hypothetical protein